MYVHAPQASRSRGTCHQLAMPSMLDAPSCPRLGVAGLASVLRVGDRQHRAHRRSGEAPTGGLVVRFFLPQRCSYYKSNIYYAKTLTLYEVVSINDYLLTWLSWTSHVVSTTRPGLLYACTSVNGIKLSTGTAASSPHCKRRSLGSWNRILVQN
jgi:hypothetical protein